MRIGGYADAVKKGPFPRYRRDPGAPVTIECWRVLPARQIDPNCPEALRDVLAASAHQRAERWAIDWLATPSSCPTPP